MATKWVPCECPIDDPTMAKEELRKAWPQYWETPHNLSDDELGRIAEASMNAEHAQEIFENLRFWKDEGETMDGFLNPSEGCVYQSTKQSIELRVIPEDIRRYFPTDH